MVLNYDKVQKDPSQEEIELILRLFNSKKLTDAKQEVDNKITKSLSSNTTIRKIIPIFLPTLTLRHLVFNKLFIKEAQKPKLPESERRKLENYYYDDVIALEKVLKKKIPWEWVKK